MNRSIPAWAGEPSPGPHSLKRKRVYPRVGGGTDTDRVIRLIRGGLSPRGRGNRRGAGRNEAQIRSIPAWAGEPVVVCVVKVVDAVYPRVGGGTHCRLT